MLHPRLALLRAPAAQRCPAKLAHAVGRCLPGPTCVPQGMRDLGLESFGAQLSLLGKQMASSLNAILPADLNPFAFDEDDYDEEELAAAAAAK